MRNVVLLGSTGSIGASTLDVIARHPDRYRVAGLAARSQWEKLREQCLQFRPRIAVLVDVEAAGLASTIAAATSITHRLRQRTAA